MLAVDMSREFARSFRTSLSDPGRISFPTETEHVVYTSHGFEHFAGLGIGLGTTFTSFHLFFEGDAAKLLGIPFEAVMQTALIPVAYTKGESFKPGSREPLGTIVHWDDW